MLHCYVEGLIPSFRDVIDLNAQPTTFAEACVAAERAAYRGKQAAASRPPVNANHYQRGSGYAAGSYQGKSDHTPMEGVNSGMKGKSVMPFNGQCRFCGVKGHKERDCWKKYPEKRPPRCQPPQTPPP